MLLRIQNLQNKLRAVEAKVKQVEDITPEDEFVRRSSDDFNEVKPMLTNLNVHDEGGTKGRCSVKASNQNVALMDKPKLGCYPLGHNGDIRSSVNQTRKSHLRGRVYGVAQENLNDRGGRHIVSVVGNLLGIHRSHPQRTDGRFPQTVLKHDLKVGGHCTVFGKNPPYERFSVNVAVNDLSLIHSDPFAFVAFLKQLGVHSPKGSPVLFPLLVSRSQIGRFSENLFADVHGFITNRNFSAIAYQDGGALG